MVMYGVTDQLTLMGMATCQSMTMEMVMNMGAGNTAAAPMRTSGFGDTELRGIYAINRHLTASLGNNTKVSGWLQRAFGPAGGWLRLAFNDTGRIHGRDPEIRKLLDATTGAPTPDADPGNYGGQRLDGFIGASYARGAFSFGVEGGMPLFQDVNGLQLVNDWYLSAGFQMMF